MIKEKVILDELKRMGIEAEQITVSKNGIPCKGIRVCSGDGSACPIIYYSAEETAEEFIRRVRSILEEKTPQIDASKLTDWDFVKEHLFLSIARQGDDNVVKMPFLNLEVQLRLFLDLADHGMGSIRITEQMEREIGVAEEDLWETAKYNTLKASSLRSLAEVLGIEENQPGGGLYVASAGMTGGASVLYFAEIFRQFCIDQGEDEAFILPSSTEEVLVLGGSEVSGHMSAQELANMVRMINEDQVDPLIRLEPAVYRYQTITDAVELVCTAEEVI